VKEMGLRVGVSHEMVEVKLLYLSWLSPSLKGDSHLKTQ